MARKIKSVDKKVKQKKKNEREIKNRETEKTKQTTIESDDDYYWNCDYCNKQFDTRKEAEMHEKICVKNPMLIE